MAYCNDKSDKWKEISILNEKESKEIGSMDLNNVLNNSTPEDIINSIFNCVYNVKLQDKRIIDIQNDSSFGFYINLNKYTNNTLFNKMHPIFKMFYVAEKKRVKFMGDNMELDLQNNLQDIRMYIFMALKEIFNKKHNHNLSSNLQIHNVNDIKRILIDKPLCHELVNYILTYVDKKIITYLRGSKNVDFNYNHNTKEFEPIYYKYIDSYSSAQVGTNDIYDYDNGYIVDNGTEVEQLLGTHENDIVSTLDKTSRYIIKNYFKELTNLQKKFVGSFLVFGTSYDGGIYDFNNKCVYTKQQVYQFKIQIKSRLEKLIKDDPNIKISKKGRMVINYGK